MARFICAVFLSVVSVTALGAETIDLGPSDWRKWDPRTSNHSLEGLRTSYGQPVRIPPGTFNVTRNPVIPYGSIGNGLKGLARLTPGAIVSSAAMAALFAGMDWVFSDGEWQKITEVTADPELQPFIWNTSYGSYDTAFAACDAYDDGFAAQYPGRTPAGSSITAMNPMGTQATCSFSIGNPQEGPYTITIVRTGSGSCPEGFQYSKLIGGCVGAQLAPLTDGDFSELTAKLPSEGAGTVGSAAGELMKRQGAPLPGFSDTSITGPSTIEGPSTTTTSTGPAGTETAVSTTTTNISYGPTTITTTNTTTTNNYTNGQPSGTTTTTETPSPDLITEPSPSPGSTSLDIPTDCEFMPTVCAFLDWFKEPVPMPEPDLPVVVDHDFEREYEMNLTAECPPPYTVDTQLFGTLSISWQPFCDLATLIKPLVVGSAFLLSAFITLGIGRGKS